MPIKIKKSLYKYIMSHLLSMSDKAIESSKNRLWDKYLEIIKEYDKINCLENKELRDKLRKKKSRIHEIYTIVKIESDKRNDRKNKIHDYEFWRKYKIEELTDQGFDNYIKHVIEYEIENGIYKV